MVVGMGAIKRIRELIIFNNALNDTEHSNIVKYLQDKWNIPLQEIVTNTFSFYSANENNTLNNAIDRDIATYFHGRGSAQDAFTSDRVLFEYRIHGSVLDGGISLLPLAIGISTGANSLYLRTGRNLNSDALRSPFKVEILRTNDNSWFVLSNVPANNTGGDKQFYLSPLPRQ